MAQESMLKLGDGNVTLRGGIGVLALSGDEVVFNGAGATDEISHLFWKSASPVLSAAIDAKLGSGWTLSAKADASSLGLGNQEDYDWFGADFVSFAFDDWTHRSQSPNGLDWYLSGSVALGYDIKASDTSTFNLNGGFKYTDVQWTTVGGSAIYSGDDTDPPGHFREYAFDLPNTPGITYRQQLPELFAGIDGKFEQGDWVFGLSGQAGVTFNARAIDDHWLRALHFVDSLDMAPVVALGVSADKTISDKLKFTVAADYERVFVARGSETASDTTGVSPDADYVDAIGGGLMSLKFSMGLKGQI